MPNRAKTVVKTELKLDQTVLNRTHFTHLARLWHSLASFGIV